MSPSARVYPAGGEGSYPRVVGSTDRPRRWERGATSPFCTKWSLPESLSYIGSPNARCTYTAIMPRLQVVVGW